MTGLLLTRAAVRELDRRAIEEFHVPSLLLMENAGRACADEVLRFPAHHPTEPVRVLCGPGNNGGDGLVIARTLWNRGVRVKVDFVGSREKLETDGDFGTNLRQWQRLGRTVDLVETAEDAAALAPLLKRAPVVVDALFGTGLARRIEDPWLAAIREVNASGRPVVAVDLPSGLDADTGEVLGAAVRATVTVTFVAEKPGFRVGYGPELCGRVVVAEIGIPRPLLEHAERASGG